MANATTATWAPLNSEADVKVNAFEPAQDDMSEAALRRNAARTSNSKAGTHAGARQGRPSWMQTWAFPAYSGLAEIV